MRVLHLGKYYAPERGGIETYTQALAEFCVEHGDEVAALVHARPGHWRSTREMVAGVEVRRVGCLAAPVYAPLSPAYPLELARLLREFRPDILHLHFPNPSCFAVLASKTARRIPWIVHWHADVPPDSQDWRLRYAYRAYRPFEHAVLARARAIIATSAEYRDASVALKPWRDKTRVVALGIAPIAPHPFASSFRRTPASSSSVELQTDSGVRRNDENENVRRNDAHACHAENETNRNGCALRDGGNQSRTGDAAISRQNCSDTLFAQWRAGGDLRLLAVGRLSVYKGFDVLIDALALLPNARVLLVGGGECDASLRQRADERAVTSRILFAGKLDDAGLARAYAEADVFVLPSRDRGEAFGLVLLEAMRAGLAVVASDIAGSGVGSVVVDDETGRLVTPSDAAALSAAIETLRDADPRKRFGAAGHARFIEHFTLARSAAAVRAIYHDAPS